MLKLILVALSLLLFSVHNTCAGVILMEFRITYLNFKEDMIFY